MKARILTMIAVALILSGCATTLYSGVKINAGTSDIDVNLPPVMYAGVKIADYSEAQGFIVVLNDFLLYNEYHRFRVSWEAVSIDADGNFHDGVVVTNLEQKSPGGHFYGHGKTLFLPGTRA